ncbi:MAG: 16S rRNA (guanine(966)-N(2))-methyltransferase RsmD [Candidatus Binatia bacterium]
MRITGGAARGRPIRAPRGSRVRPTADKVRGAIFNILAARGEIEGRRVLDLFCGSGALGLEALSRGASRAIFVDKSFESCRIARQNVERNGFAAVAEVRRLALPGGLRHVEDAAPFDGVFVDPPYRRGLSQAMMDVLGGGGFVLGGGWAVVEHGADEQLEEAYGVLHRVDSRRYGSTAISLYRNGGKP